MRNIDIINACTDLGVAVNGASLGPDELTQGLKNDNINNVYKIYTDCSNKEKDKDNKKKNLKRLNEFNERLYEAVLKSITDGNFPLTIGGDHSLAISSALASINKNKKTPPFGAKS